MFNILLYTDSHTKIKFQSYRSNNQTQGMTQDVKHNRENHNEKVRLRDPKYS